MATDVLLVSFHDMAANEEATATEGLSVVVLLVGMAPKQREQVIRRRGESGARMGENGGIARRCWMPRRGNCRPSWFGSSLQVKVTGRADWDANFETAAVDQGVTVAPPGGSVGPFYGYLSNQNQPRRWGRCGKQRSLSSAQRPKPETQTTAIKRNVQHAHCQIVSPGAKYSSGCVRA
jgi:hypothetical protein